MMDAYKEPRTLCLTGRRWPAFELQPSLGAFLSTDGGGPLDAPDYVPTGGVRLDPMGAPLTCMRRRDGE